MKKIYFIILLTVLSSLCYAQKDMDSIIVLKTADTNNLHNRIKWAMINMEFIVKDLPSNDTLKTYAPEFLNNDFMIVTAIIIGDRVKFTGIWGSRQLSILGYSNPVKDYKRILYYKSCVEWKIMRKIAEGVGGVLTFN